MSKVLFKHPRPNTSVYVHSAEYGRRIITFGPDALYATDDEEEIAALMKSKAVRVGSLEVEDAKEDVQEAEPEVEAEAPKVIRKRAPRKATTGKKT